MKTQNLYCLAGCLFFAFLAVAPPVQAQDNVLITEFMATNTHTLVDEDGQFSDWIEIHNAGTNMVNLNGWFLTDSPSALSKWSFPSTNLAASGYMVVFASGKNRRIPGASLHTSFKLGNNGEYLALVHPDGVTVAFSYAPKYPVQVADISYGIPTHEVVSTLVAGGTGIMLGATSDSDLWVVAFVLSALLSACSYFVWLSRSTP